MLRGYPLLIWSYEVVATVPAPDPVVWSVDGPVPELVVLLPLSVQSKSSLVSCVHAHRPVSKSQISEVAKHFNHHKTNLQIYAR